MKSVTFFFLLIGSFSAFAQVKQTLTCTGENVILREESTTLNQSLWTIESLQSTTKAFFLDDVEVDISRTGVMIIVGKNKAGGTFTLVTEPFPGQTIKGTLTYIQGSLQGQDELVDCAFH